MRLWNTQVNMRRLFALLLAGVLVAGCVPAVYAAQTSGECGDSLTWELNEDTLVIFGSGEMWDFPESTMAPWYPVRDQISQVVLPEGLTSVGDLAFYDCGRLNTVVVPDSVRRIGRYAFALCKGMTMLDLGDGVQVLDKAALRECTGLTSVRLPDSLITIGFQAFYRCDGLTSIVVPASVTDMGMTVFGYCFSLIRAEIHATIQRLPDWTFYGCDALTDVYFPIFLTGCEEYAFYGCGNLSNVEFEGDANTAYQIQQDIQRDLESSGIRGTVSSNRNDVSSIYTEFEENNGDLVSNTTVTQQTGNASVSSKETVTYPSEDVSNSTGFVDMDVTLENPDGWNEIQDMIVEAAGKQDSMHIDIFLKDGTALPEGALSDLAEKNVTVSVNTSSGSSWQMDCSQMVVGEVDPSVDLSYERLPATQEQVDALGGAPTYQVHFNNTVDTQVEIMIRLPSVYSGDNAFLYQMNGGKPERLQASRVDRDGYAHFYIASVDQETDYLIGIDVPGENTDNVIIPKKEEKAFDITDTLAPMDYVITGRKSSWGMEIGQVTWIMAGVLIGSVVLIGVVLYLMNKRKLKKGYVVDLDEYELN